MLRYDTDFRRPIAGCAEFDDARSARGAAIQGTFVNISRLSNRLPGKKGNREASKEKKPALRAGSGGDQSFHTKPQVLTFWSTIV
jgi:hypothetical protein